MAMLEQLTQLCDTFSSVVATSTATTPEPLDLKPAQELLADFIAQSKSVLETRKKTLAAINFNRPDDPLSIRQFIRQAPEPLRTQLERKRDKIIERLYAIRSQVASDSAVVFYSFDFYRRIVNGLVNCIAEEQGYDQAGKSTPNPVNKFYQRAC